MREALADRHGDAVTGRIAYPANLWIPQILLVDADAIDPAGRTELQLLADELATSGRVGGAIVVSGGFAALPVVSNLAIDGSIHLPPVLGSTVR